MSFNKFWDDYGLKRIMKSAKTLSKKECQAIFRYLKENKPKMVFEFGVQYGCSSRLFIDASKELGYRSQLHSWDVIRAHKHVGKNEFSFHKKDITGKEEKAFDKYKPELVFLDAHVYKLTRNLMQICLERKINFMAHDINLLSRCEKRSKGFTDFSPRTNAQWEPYLLGKLIHEDLWTLDSYENDALIVDCVRDKYGLAIVRHK